ncbi:SMI1/KNR4 family protein [Pedobacter jeongneungensis]|uniref:SMI1/KNR4 family protein n=1 Tax=Pedobacter jeongneungensis TaxID=947309 RepID=UPI000468E6DE|nr:SMI1/KNR4 family protein [Pedobacter jeongneungensis]
MNYQKQSLHNYLKELDEEYGGDISFIPKVDAQLLANFERTCNWTLPEIFKFFLTSECNGLIIGNKRILSIYDQSQKKTFVESLERNNDPDKSPLFKGRPQIFNDYLVIGSDGEVCFCYSKKYDFPNPGIYICENANSKNGVDFENLEMDLIGLIKTMIANEFE